jgi:hypothetical protein
MAMEVALAIRPDTEVLAWLRDAVRLQHTLCEEVARPDVRHRDFRRANARLLHR